MFKKRKAKDVAVPKPSPPASAFSPQQEPRPTPSSSRPPLTPVQMMDFDFDLPSPSFGGEVQRPQTSDGVAPRSSSLNSVPPILPPIPRVSSQMERDAPGAGREEMDRDAIIGKAMAKYEQMRSESAMSGSNAARSNTTFDGIFDRSSSPKVASPGFSKLQDTRPATSAGPSEFKMESSLFPTKAPPPPIDTDTPMSRAWIDARDKPYAAPPARPQLQSANSSPDLRAAARPSTVSPTRDHILAMSNNAAPRPVLQQSFSTQSMTSPFRPPSNAPTNYSGTTARSTHSSKSTAVGFDAPFRTIGRPYGETSQSFPLPQHVATRPKTAGSMATVRGVEVPTHHTSAVKARPEAPAKTEKRKTKLLNPMHLLARRRSGQDDEAQATDRAAQAQALQRQKNVAAVGVNSMPEDFDPRIRGKVVHDFSAPRQSRMFSYNDAIGPWSQERGLQSSNSVPYIHSTSPDEEGAQRMRVVSDSSPRRSLHTPIFKEHLDPTENAAYQSDAGAIQAERLENKAFLNRASQISQESAVLPPFARRSHQLDTLQTAYLHDNEGPVERSIAGQKEPEPRVSESSSGVSPITQRGSVLPGATDAARQSMSPVSPATPDRTVGSRPFSRPISALASERPVSEVSKIGSADVTRPTSTVSSTSDIGRTPSDAIPRHVSVPPAVESIAEEQTPKLGDGFIPMPERQAPAAPTALEQETPLLNLPPQQSSSASPALSSQSYPSAQPTPEPETADTATAPKTPPKLVQKRADAVGHAKRASSGATPKHMVSNASRFSFQFGGSAVEEQALEEKGRRLTLLSGSEIAPNGDYDEDDYFDEDAMDDMDEMEMQGQQDEETDAVDDIGTRGLTAGPGLNPDAAYAPTFMPMSNARKLLQLDDGSESGSNRGSGIETPYWKHDAFNSYAHTREPSVEVNQALHRRKPSDDAAKLTLNTNVGPHGSGFVQDGYAINGGARSGFYMQPQAAGYSPTLARGGVSPPKLPHRNSGNSEQNRTASGLQFGKQAGHKATTSNSTMSSLAEVTNRSFSGSSGQGSGTADTTGLGLSGFSGFKFVDSPEASRPLSQESTGQRHLNPNRPSGADRSRGDSETLPHAATFGATGVATTSPPDRNIGSALDQYEDDHYDLDDMYFDDGGFEPDVNNRNHLGEAIDENVFDDDAFLRRPNGVGHAVQPLQQNGSGSDSYGLVADGPYPSFTLPRSTRSRERDSNLLLEDLPLYEQPFDPKWIPRRNPSEDAKRLGLTDRAPPLPVPGTTADAAARVQANLSAYHATLAEALNKAAADGRFSRKASTSTLTSDGAYPAGDGEDVETQFKDDRSQTTEVDDDETPSIPNGNPGLQPIDPKTGSGLDADRGMYYRPPSMSFDFGFDSAPIDDSVVDSDFDDLGDDDIIAAANAEALAGDDEGFYGQEFGFYAKARPNSNEVEAINGGFFGLDGDDGLARQKSLKEPNLTPITERSEFSTRNSFIGLHGPPSASVFGPFPPGSSRLPVSPWMGDEVTTFDQLRKLKASAFAGSNLSLHSDSSGGLQMNSGSAPVSARSSAAAQGYFGPLGGAPMTFGYSTDSSGSSNPGSAHPHHTALHVQDSPHSAASSSQLPFSMDPDATPRRPSTAVDTPMTVRKVSDKPNRGHSRASSGADSVTYVREEDPDGNRPPRWVLEKRRTSEQGQLELVAREIVQDGWI